MTEPTPPTRAAITELLARIPDEGTAAEDQLLPFVYDEMRGLARAVFSSQSPQHTLQPTAVVHEAWLKLVGNLDEVKNRRHFFAIAAKAMRQVLHDHARELGRQKRGGGARAVTLHDAPGRETRTYDLVAFETALTELAELNERHARLVELRFFGGLTIGETAAELGVSESTVVADWTLARAWLRRQLAD